MRNAEARRSGYGLVVGLMLGVGTLGWADSGFCRAKSRAEAPASQPIVVRVHDYTGLGSTTLEHAQRETTWVFHKVGIEVTWVECPPHAPDLRQYPACIDPGPAPVIDMNILPRAMATWAGLHETTLGFTWFTEEGQRNSLAAVFYDRVKEEAERSTVSLPQILAYAMAHELGHLLLRTERHSPAGIMQASWTLRVLQSAAKRQLTFSPQQAERMRNEVSQRQQGMAAAGSVTATASK